MPLIPIPDGSAYPTTADTVLVGFTDGGFTTVESVKRSAVVGLVAGQGSFIDPANPPEEPYTTAFCVVASDDPFNKHGIVIAAFTSPEERRQYIRSYSANWLS